MSTSGGATTLLPNNGEYNNEFWLNSTQMTSSFLFEPNALPLNNKNELDYCSNKNSTISTPLVRNEELDMNRSYVVKLESYSACTSPTIKTNLTYNEPSFPIRNTYFKDTSKINEYSRSNNDNNNFDYEGQQQTTLNLNYRVKIKFEAQNQGVYECNF